MTAFSSPLRLSVRSRVRWPKGQTGHRLAASLLGLSRYLLRCKGCATRRQGKPHLAHRTLFHPHHGRNCPFAYRIVHGEQAHSYPLCFADDGYMVPLHGHSQQVCGYAERALSRSRKSKDTAWLPHRNDVRLLHGICRNVRHRIAYPFPTLKEIAEDDARSRIKITIFAPTF